MGVWRDTIVMWCDTHQCGGWWHGDHGGKVVAQAAGHGEDAKDEDHFPERRTRQAETRSRRQREKSPPVRGGTITGGELKIPIWKSESFVGNSRIHQIKLNFPIWKYESFVGNFT